MVGIGIDGIEMIQPGIVRLMAVSKKLISQSELLFAYSHYFSVVLRVENSRLDQALTASMNKAMTQGSHTCHPILINIIR